MHSPASPLVLFGITAGVLFSSCRRETSERADSEWWQLEGDRIELEAKVELHQIRIDKHLAKVAEVNGTLLEYDDARQKVANLDEKAAQLRSDIGNLTERISDLHHIARRDRREASVGVKLDSLVGMNGRDYKDVEITSITDAGLIINHSSGIARLVASDLSKEQQFQFGIDSQLSQEAVARESAKVVAYHRLVDEHTEQTLAQKEVEDRRIAILPRPSPRVVSDTTVASGNPLHEPPRPIGGSRYRSYYRADYYNRYSSYYQPNSRTTYSPPGPATRYSVPGSGRRINGTPAPTRTSPPRSTPSLPCPND